MVVTSTSTAKILDVGDEEDHPSPFDRQNGTTRVAAQLEDERCGPDAFSDTDSMLQDILNTDVDEIPGKCYV